MTNTEYQQGQIVVLNWEYDVPNAMTGEITIVYDDGVYGVRWSDGTFGTLFADELAPGN